MLSRVLFEHWDKKTGHGGSVAAVTNEAMKVAKEGAAF
jgi:hypothetical protein